MRWTSRSCCVVPKTALLTWSAVHKRKCLLAKSVTALCPKTTAPVPIVGRCSRKRTRLKLTLPRLEEAPGPSKGGPRVLPEAVPGRRGRPPGPKKGGPRAKQRRPSRSEGAAPAQARVALPVQKGRPPGPSRVALPVRRRAAPRPKQGWPSRSEEGRPPWPKKGGPPVRRGRSSRASKRPSQRRSKRRARKGGPSGGPPKSPRRGPLVAEQRLSRCWSTRRATRCWSPTLVRFSSPSKSFKKDAVLLDCSIFWPALLTPLPIRKPEKSSPA